MLKADPHLVIRQAKKIHTLARRQDNIEYLGQVYAHLPDYVVSTENKKRASLRR